MKSIIFFVFLVLFSYPISAALPQERLPLYSELKVNNYDNSSGVAELLVIVELDNNIGNTFCHNFMVSLVESKKIKILDDVHWSVEIDSTELFQRNINIQIEPNDTGSIWIEIRCSNLNSPLKLKRYLIAGDSLEIHYTKPRSYPEPKQDHHVKIDTLPYEIQSGIMEVELSIPSIEKENSIKRIIDNLPELDDNNQCVVQITLLDFAKIEKETGIEGRIIDLPEEVAKIILSESELKSFYKIKEREDKIKTTINFDSFSNDQLTEELDVLIYLSNLDSLEIVKRFVEDLEKTGNNKIYSSKLSLNKIRELLNIETNINKIQVGNPPDWLPPVNMKLYNTTLEVLEEGNFIKMEINESHESKDMKQKIGLEYLDKLEMNPLLKQATEAYFVDGYIWRRNKGESKFVREEPVTDEFNEIQRSYYDSLKSLPFDSEVKVCIAIKNDEQRSILNDYLNNTSIEMVDNIFHASLKKSEFIELKEEGFNINYQSYPTCNHSIHSKKN